jgi:hypothetical protein
MACNTNDSSVETFVPDAATVAAIEKYSPIGVAHNEMLDGFYGKAENTRSVLTDDERKAKFNKYFEITDEAKRLELPIFQGRSVEPTSIIDQMESQNIFQETESAYLKRIESILYTSSASVDDVKVEITKIEADAVANLSEEKLPIVMSYAETAKASITYWSEHPSLLEDFNPSLIGCNSARAMDPWKLGFLVAAADAAGASGGIAAAILIPQIAPAAIAISVYCGAVSSAHTYEQETFIVIIDLLSYLNK